MPGPGRHHPPGPGMGPGGRPPGPGMRRPGPMGGPGMGRPPMGRPPMGRPPFGRPPIPPPPPRRGWGTGPYHRGGCMGCLFPFLMGAAGLTALLVMLLSVII